MEKLLNILTNFFKDKAKTNFWLYTLPVHILGLISLGLMTYLGDWNYLFYTLIFYFLFGCVGMAIGLHRYWGHGAFTMPKWKERFVTLMGVYNGYGSIFP